MARVLIVGLLAAAAVTFSGFAFTQPSSSPRVPPRATSRSAETDFTAPVVEAKALPAVSESFVNFSRAAFAVLAALAVAFVPMDGAEAARSGGRMGGMGGSRPQSRAAPPRSAPSARSGVGASVGGAPTVVVSPMMSPFGFSPYGGFGYSPFGFGGGFGGGFGSSGTDQRIQEQQRQDERSIDQQKSQIDALQKEIETLKAQKK